MEPAQLARGLLFDFDGTLYGDWRLWTSIIEATLSDFQLFVTADEALEIARRMIRTGRFVNNTIRISGVATTLARDRGVSRDDEIRARFFEKLDASMDGAGPGDGLIRLLQEFARNDFRMGIVTFVRKPRILHRLSVWKLKEYFQSVVTPDEVQEFKPSPQPFLKAMNELQVPPDACFVVGDEPVDMIGGKKAGAKTVGLPQGFFSKEELEEAGADYILNSLDLLPTVVYREAGLDTWSSTTQAGGTSPC